LRASWQLAIGSWQFAIKNRARECLSSGAVSLLAGLRLPAEASEESGSDGSEAKQSKQRQRRSSLRQSSALLPALLLRLSALRGLRLLGSGLVRLVDARPLCAALDAAAGSLSTFLYRASCGFGAVFHSAGCGLGTMLDLGSGGFSAALHSRLSCGLGCSASPRAGVVLRGAKGTGSTAGLGDVADIAYLEGLFAGRGSRGAAAGLRTRLAGGGASLGTSGRNSRYFHLMADMLAELAGVAHQTILLAVVSTQHDVVPALADAAAEGSACSSGGLGPRSGLTGSLCPGSALSGSSTGGLGSRS